MKYLYNIVIFLILVISTSAEDFKSGGIFVNSASENLKWVSVDKASIHTNDLVVGKTYYVDSKTFEVHTLANEFAELILSNQVQLYLNPHSELVIDAFNQLILNPNSPPEKIKDEYSILTLSLFSGHIELRNLNTNLNSQCILQTPFVNVLVGKGSISVKSNPKYVMLNSFKGAINIVDIKNKQDILEEGNMGLVIPFPGRDGEIMLTQKKISPDEFLRIDQIITRLQVSNAEILFAIIQQEILGIRLR